MVQLWILWRVTDRHLAGWIRFNESRVKRLDIMLGIDLALLAYQPFEICGKGLPDKRLFVIGGAAKGARRIQKLDGPFTMIVEVTRISDIIFVAAVDIVAFKCTHRIAVFRLRFFIQQLAWEHTPSQEFASPIEHGKETVLLPPERVLVLLAHANEVDGVQMRVR